MLKLFSTCPPSLQFEPQEFLARAVELAKWNEESGISGTLIYTDNSLIDPWVVAQAILQETTTFVPLIATQPLYMSPYWAAKRISTIAFLYGRKVALNMVAGGFVKDLEQLGDDTEHDARYDRLVEYVEILQALLSNEEVTYEGEYYSVNKLKLTPEMPQELCPDIYLSGASEACIKAAKRIDATRISYTKPPHALDEFIQSGTLADGLRFGVIARPTSEEAWAEADKRYPVDRRGQMAHRMASLASDSIWHKQMAEFGEKLSDEPSDPYWLRPLKTYKTFCPYLVGSYEEVAAYMRGYLDLGFDTIIFDVPENRAELDHTLKAMTLAQEQAGQPAPAEQKAVA